VPPKGDFSGDRFFLSRLNNCPDTIAIQAILKRQSPGFMKAGTLLEQPYFIIPIVFAG